MISDIMLFAMTGSENLAHPCPRSPQIRPECLCSASEILGIGSQGGSSDERSYLRGVLKGACLAPSLPRPCLHCVGGRAGAAAITGGPGASRVPGPSSIL